MTDRRLDQLEAAGECMPHTDAPDERADKPQFEVASTPMTAADPLARISSMVWDCADPPALANWWQRLIGGQLVPWPQHGVVTLRAPGLTIDFVAVPEQKHTKNRLHLDLRDDGDGRQLVTFALNHGATRAEDIFTGDAFTVLRDPEGNEFCVLHYAPP